MLLFAYIVLARAHIFLTLWQAILARSATAADQVSCISNFADMKQAIFQEETGNMERLLYAFTPPNQPPPHYIWVYYFHNQSSEWKDILTCPPYNVLHRCPLDHEESETHDERGSSGIEDASEYHAVFWGDSPMLINLDIPLLRALSYNSILQYLGNESCVEIVIPPFCAHVDSASEKEIYNFVTTYVSYGTTSIYSYVFTNL